ncbi:unnamed protein product (macronuclear) [Paramecium tetraurelia]|uniref:Uncharacterized protein n=1 Tax=Paramecium tetraurelia TaxID=5888 RepID=A0CW28_PARTE|nr:uncharacterized protein GSPATT00001197001 [Paramecium tetraurelia]CAK74995.1 unnamed protein product [Paramecium tetraurelia]|eukprot:XP_001442392.1 hypothetical protein (macronuclear) [Paramecium tetraurelia strain d4-2]
MSRQIYVGRLGSKIRREDLQQEFEKYGKIKDIDLRSTHAFIEFEASDEAKQAISQVDGRRIGGDRVTVKQRDDRPSGVRGPTTRDVCFNCGRKGHWANECKEGDLRETCYRCYKKGHIKKECPVSRTPSDAKRQRRDRKRRRSSSSSKSSSSSSKSRRRSRNFKKNRQNRRQSRKSSSESRKSNSSQTSRSSSKNS